MGCCYSEKKDLLYGNWNRHQITPISDPAIDLDLFTEFEVSFGLVQAKVSLLAATWVQK